VLQFLVGGKAMKEVGGIPEMTCRIKDVFGVRCNAELVKYAA
jgi:hypothetical protein